MADNAHAIQNVPHAAMKPAKGECRATQTWPLFSKLLPGEPVAFDVEFQEYKRENDVKWAHRLGRATAVNTRGEVILDVYAAYPKEKGTLKKMPPRRFGVTWRDLQYENGAVPAHKVEKWFKAIFKDRTVVMHDARLDTRAFCIEEQVFSSSSIVDTQNLYARDYRRPKMRLGLVACDYLNREIQADGRHYPDEDVRATMDAYLLKCPYDRDATAKETHATEDARRGATNLRRASTRGRGSRRGRRGRGGQNFQPNRPVAAHEAPIHEAPAPAFDEQEFPPLPNGRRYR